MNGKISLCQGDDAGSIPAIRLSHIKQTGFVIYENMFNKEELRTPINFHNGQFKKKEKASNLNYKD